MATLPPPQSSLEGAVSSLVSESDAQQYESEEHCEDHGNVACPAGCSRYHTVSWPVADHSRQLKALEKLTTMSLDDALPIILYSNELSNSQGIRHHHAFLANGWHCEPPYFMAICEDGTNPDHVRINALKFMRYRIYSEKTREATGLRLLSLAISDEPDSIRLESLHTLQSIGVCSPSTQQSLRKNSYPWSREHHWTHDMKSIGIRLSDFPTTLQSLTFSAMIAGGTYFGIAAMQPYESFPYSHAISNPDPTAILATLLFGVATYTLCGKIRDSK